MAQGKSKLPIDARYDAKNDKGLWVIYRVSQAVSVYGCFGLGYKVRIAGKLLKVCDLNAGIS